MKVHVQFSSAEAILQALNRVSRFTACKVYMCTKVLNVFRTESPVTLEVGTLGKSLTFETLPYPLVSNLNVFSGCEEYSNSSRKRKKIYFLYYLHSVIQRFQ